MYSQLFPNVTVLLGTNDVQISTHSADQLVWHLTQEKYVKDFKMSAPPS